MNRTGKRIRVFAGALVLTLAGGSNPASAVSVESLSTTEMTRSLQRVQDQIVSGDAAAVQMQADLMRFNYDTLSKRSLELTTLSDQEFHALLLFVLMSGKPSLLVNGLDDAELAEDRKALAMAVSTYRGMGRPSRLTDVDISGLPSMLGAMISLVRSTNRQEPLDVIRDLTEARFLAPGTMIEEAALRLLAKAHLASDDTAAFLSVAHRYFRQFPQSPYASEIHKLMQQSITRINNPDLLARLDSTIDVLAPEQAEALRDGLIRQAAIESLEQTVSFLEKGSMASEPLQPDGNSSADADQRLYSAMSRLGSADIGTINTVLESVNEAELSARNRALLEAARQVVSEVSTGVSVTPEIRPAESVSPSLIAPSGDAAPAQGSAAMTGDEAPSIDFDGFVSSIQDKVRGVDAFLEEIDQ